MKILPLYHNEKLLIQKARIANKAAQHGLYRKYAPIMLVVCRRYVKDVQFAEDVMIQGFLKAFMRLNSFKGEGSFEGWVRRIMVNESINYLKKKRRLVFESNTSSLDKLESPCIVKKTDAEYLLKLIDDLPDTYRFVFMLHAIDGYKHNEIAKVLGIPENTSKSKLSRARKILQNKLKIQRKKYEAL
jgi:RNA polymerase sigma-70 factor (ECF subfamily)